MIFVIPAQRYAHDVIALRRKSLMLARMRELKKELPDHEYGSVRFLVTTQLRLYPLYIIHSWAPSLKPEEIIDDMPAGSDC